MENEYRVVYTNEILEGFALDEVVADMVALFKISPEQAMDILLKKKPIVLKKHLSQEKAAFYANKLSAIGLKIAIKGNRRPQPATAATEPV
jgi:hypothetical protein